MNIALIFGGRSGEHEISLISAAAIARGIEDSNNIVLIGISKDGKWYLQDKSELERIKKDTKSPLIIQEKEENLVSVIPGNSFYRTVCPSICSQHLLHPDIPVHNGVLQT